MKRSYELETDKKNAEVALRLVKVQGQHYFYTRILPLLSIVLATIIALIVLVPERIGKLNTADQLSTAEILVQTEVEIVQAPAPQIQKLVVNKPKRVFLYAQPNSKSDILTSVASANLLLVKQIGEQWAEVLTFDGIPVWVQAKDINSYVRGYSKLITETANAYSKPSIEEGEILGALDADDILRIIVVQKDWYRVWSPRTFSAWVKTNELEKI